MSLNRSTDFVVRNDAEVARYIPWLNDLYLKEERINESLGFFPTQTYHREAACGRIFVGFLNGQPCGYLYAGAFHAGKDVKIFQACLEFDIRRNLYGSLLVAHLLSLATAAGCTGATLRCGFDLTANTFWEKVGFYVYAYRPGGLRRGRILNCWRTDIGPMLFTFDKLPVMRGERDSKLWRKYKDILSLSDVSRSRQSWEELLPLIQRPSP